MRTPRTRRVLTLALAGAACLALTLTAFAAGGEAAVSGMYATFWALVPPVVAIVLALITKEAYSSLFIGVLVGALFQCGFAPVDTLDTMLSQGFVSAIEGNAGIFLFLVLLGIIVALVNASGGSAAFGRWAQRNIRTRVGASLATFVLGILIFIDDYFNCLTVGSVMRPVTDGHRISRPKLAYLIDATAAPVCMIAPVSSWAAAVSGVAADLDTGVSGIELFIQAIPYNFYSLLTFVFIISLAVMRFDYGPMQLCEQNAREKGELAAVQGSDDGEGNPKGRVIDLIIPVVILFVLCTVGMIYVGGFFGVDAWGGTENAGSFIGAFGNTDAFIGLPWGGIVALVLIVAYVVARRVLTFKEAMACVPKGFVAMVPPITILTLAVSLKNMTNLLGADVFVQNAMEASGTSWGTFGILIPIVVSVFEPSSTLLTIGISACLAGAVCGDHCSPISDTTIMASAGAQCDHVTHVSTQLPYAVTVAAVSFVTFILAGFVQNAVICLIVGAALTVGTLLALRSMNSKRA